MVVIGKTVGVADPELMILPVDGVQEKIPVPSALNCRLSMLQIRVSLKGRVSRGLSSTISGTVTVFAQPFVLVAESVTG